MEIFVFESTNNEACRKTWDATVLMMQLEMIPAPGNDPMTLDPVRVVDRTYENKAEVPVGLLTQSR
jgi:hypothetical protein